MTLKIVKIVSVCFPMLMASYSSVTHSADEWVADEILQQLSELRRDHNNLQKQVDELKSELIKKQPSGTDSYNKREVSLDDDPSMGDRNAKIVMVEFTDYQCPYCKRHTQNTLPQLKKAYIDTGSLLYVMKDYPLGFHSQAASAATAANCAGEQNAYWKMHEQLFSSNIRFGREGYLKIAQALALDEVMFKQCLDDPQQKQEIDSDFTYGSKLGVQGTPAFFIGKHENGRLVDGVFVSGAQPFSRFSAIVDDFLAE